MRTPPTSRCAAAVQLRRRHRQDADPGLGGAFALFYTGTIGAGALAPVLFGQLGDVMGVPFALIALAAILLFTLPLSWRVDKEMRASRAPGF